MQDNEEAKIENGNYLKDRAESIVNLLDVLDKIQQGKIICRSPSITHAIEELIADLCGEIYTVMYHETLSKITDTFNSRVYRG